MTREWREQWDREGYLVVRGLFDAARTARLLDISEGIWAQWRRRDAQTGKPGGGPDATCMRHLNHPDYFLDRPAAHFCELMDAVADELVLGIARAILGQPPLFRCTSFWHNPEQTSQDGNWHRDIQFISKTEDEEREKLNRAAYAGESGIQMQIPLVASADIEYVPGSHLRWDTAEEYAIRCADGRARNRSNTMPGALRFELQPGDAALFNPNGLHRGRYHADKPRRTLMFTYTQTSRPCFDYFSNQPWFLREGHLDALSLRTRAFFETFAATYRDDWQKQPAACAAS